MIKLCVTEELQMFMHGDTFIAMCDTVIVML
jgi:hypothetical protein